MARDKDGRGAYRPNLHRARALRGADSAEEVRAFPLADLVFFGILVFSYVDSARIGSRDLPGIHQTAPVVWRWIIASANRCADALGFVSFGTRLVRATPTQGGPGSLWPERASASRSGSPIPGQGLTPSQSHPQGPRGNSRLEYRLESYTIPDKMIKPEFWNPFPRPIRGGPPCCYGTELGPRGCRGRRTH